MSIPHLRNARKRGVLLARQLKELSILERQYEDAKGTLKILKQRDEELYKLEQKDEPS